MKRPHKEPARQVNQPPQEPRTPASASLRKYLFGGLLFVAAVVLGYFVVTWLLRPTLPDSIVGEWRMAGGDIDGTRFSFARDGTFKAKLTVNGKEVEVQAHVEMHDDTLRYTILNPATGKNEIKIQTIKSLTDQEMVVEENRQQSRLVRIGDRK